MFQVGLAYTLSEYFYFENLFTIFKDNSVLLRYLELKKWTTKFNYSMILFNEPVD